MSAERIAKALGGKRSGSGGWSCRCPAHDDRSPSLLVSDGDKGVLVRCFAGCDARDVLAALRRLNLLADDRQYQPQPHRLVVDNDAEARSDFARRIWLESRPPERTPVEAYLRGRGITGEIPPTIRFHPGLKHSATGLHLPGMVAAVTVAPESRVVAIHRTFLTLDGRKAPVSTGKAMLGPCRCGAVRLGRAGAVLVIAEGIETALSIQTATGIPAWAALSAGGVEAVTLPPLPLASEIIIAADNDASGRGQRAADVLAERCIAEGRAVRIAMPPNTGDDFNTLLQEAAHVG